MATVSSHGRNLACAAGVAAGFLVASPGNASLQFYDHVPARLAIELDGFPTLALEQEIAVEIDPGAWPYQRLAALELAAGALQGDFTSVEGTLSGQALWLDAEISSDAAHLATEGDHLAGALPLAGFADGCLAPCEDVDPLLTFPLDSIGGAEPPVLSIDGTWTTGTVVSGELEATGHNLAAEVSWTDVAAPWWSVSLVTPIRLVPEAGAPVTGIARLDLSAWIPQCSDGIDDDGDERSDYPDDPGCSDANDLEEGLELFDGALHEIDASILPGERLFIGGSDLYPTRVRMREPAELGEVRVFGGEFSMEGGKLRGALELFGGSATVSGGQLSSLWLAFGASASLQGAFDRPVGEIPDLQGHITGTLADGTPLDVLFSRDPESTLVVPEAGAVAGSVAAALALASYARAKR